jgi:hypothetical protein
MADGKPPMVDSMAAGEHTFCTLTRIPCALAAGHIHRTHSMAREAGRAQLRLRAASFRLVSSLGSARSDGVVVESVAA